MRSETHPKIQISGYPSSDAILAHPGNPDGLPFVHPRWDPNFQSLSSGFSSTPVHALQRNSAFRPCHRLFERDHNVALKVAPALDKASFLRRASTWPPKFVGPIESAATTKELFKKIAEPGPIKVKLHVLFAARRTPTSAPAARWAPESSRFPSIHSQIVILAAVRGIAKNLVGFVDLLKLF